MKEKKRFHCLNWKNTLYIKFNYRRIWLVRIVGVWKKTKISPDKLESEPAVKVRNTGQEALGLVHIALQRDGQNSERVAKRRGSCRKLNREDINRGKLKASCPKNSQGITEREKFVALGWYLWYRIRNSQGSCWSARGRRTAVKIGKSKAPVSPRMARLEPGHIPVPLGFCFGARLCPLLPTGLSQANLPLLGQVSVSPLLWGQVGACPSSLPLCSWIKAELPPSPPQCGQMWP